MKAEWILVVLLLFTACSYERTEDFDAAPYDDGFYDGEQYNDYGENPFLSTTAFPVSTFSIDADGASYSNVRRFINDGWLPPNGAVRVEEMINYFSYDYPNPTGNDPISVTAEIANCPWSQGHKLMQIRLKGKDVAFEDLPAANMVLLVDVSGSMSNDDKLPLLKESFKLLVDVLRPQDRVAVVTYSGNVSVVLDATAASEKELIKNAIDMLDSGGGTAGGAGIVMAYDIAAENFVEGGNNRIILATDGDFNLGLSTPEELVELIKTKRDQGIFLTAVGVGTGNYNDAMMEQVADNGNGTYEYIDRIEEAEKVFVQDFGKLYTVAKDVKVQMTFDSTLVDQYRLIGYVNRLLNSDDFVDDTEDAGEIGAGQTITAIYEIIPQSVSTKDSYPFTIDFRYKLPDSDNSVLLSLDAFDEDKLWNEASEDFRFAASVAGFGMLLRNSAYMGTCSYDGVIDWVNNAQSYNPYGYKTDFVTVIEKAMIIE